MWIHRWPVAPHKKGQQCRKCFRVMPSPCISYNQTSHYNDVIMSAMASQITSLTIVYKTVYSRRRSKKTSKLRVTGLCAGNSSVTGEFLAQRVSNAENVSIWWRHHEPPHHWPFVTWNPRRQRPVMRNMMTSSNGNIFRVTGHLCGEFTGPRWIPRAKASEVELWCFPWSTPE